MKPHFPLMLLPSLLVMATCVFDAAAGTVSHYHRPIASWLARKLAKLEKKYDAKFHIVLDAIRDLMEPPVRARKTARCSQAGRVNQSTFRNDAASLVFCGARTAWECSEVDGMG